MSGHGRPPLCKPEHVSRARELCARGVINPDLLEPASWARQQNERRKGRKPRIVGKWGPFRRWREAAESGGNPLQDSARETVHSFAVSSNGSTP